MRKDFIISVKFFIFFFLLTACSGKEFTAVFVTPEGTVQVSLELAKTVDERQRGLMFRDRIGDREGMLFCFDRDRKPSFWMKNTYLSLDILFLSGSGEVVAVLERLPPCPMEPCPRYTSDSEARYALEVKSGFVAEHHVRKGDIVRLSLEGE